MTPARRAFSVAVYARKGDRVLVIEHKRLQTWLPIGGELEPGETPAEAAVRELVEETGMVGEFRKLVGATERATHDAMRYLERHALTRVTAGGVKRRERVEWLYTVAVHAKNRSGEPNLHAHVVVWTRGLRADGRRLGTHDQVLPVRLVPDRGDEDPLLLGLHERRELRLYR